MDIRDLVTFAVAITLHAGLAWGLARVPLRDERPPSKIEVDVIKKKPPPPAITPPKKEEVVPPPPPPKVAVKQKLPPPVAPPPPNVTPPKEPPKEPPKPVFGVSMESTTEGDSSFAVNVGNTTMIDPKDSAKKPSGPLPQLPASAPAQPSYKPVSALEVRDQPEIDGELCGKAVKYPEEAEQLGIEGDVTLRIELDEAGKVHAIKVLRGLGHGLDQAAMAAMRYRAECRFKPAIGTDGKKKSYVIERYVFHFEIPR